MRQLKSQNVQNRANHNKVNETEQVQVKFDSKNMAEDSLVRYSIDDEEDLNDRQVENSTIKKKLKPQVPRFRKEAFDKNQIISKQYDAKNIGSFIAELG